MLELVWVPNFTLNKQFWILGPNLPEKSIFGRKQEKEHHHWILHIRISPSAKFQLKLTTLSLLDQTCPSVEKKKIEHHYWILHIGSSLGNKFQLKLTILIFRIKFAQKGYFYSRTEKVNTTMEISIFELV